MHTAETVTDSLTPPPQAPRYETLLTARATVAQLSGLPAEVARPDVLASAGPVRAFHVDLSTGKVARVIFHERHQFIEVVVPQGGLSDAEVMELLARMRIGPHDVTWRHPALSRNTSVCSHCGQQLANGGGGLDAFLSQLGITDAMIGSLKTQFETVDIDECLDAARDYLKDGNGKAVTYAKENPGKVAAGVVALALGAGLIYAAMRDEK